MIEEKTKKKLIKVLKHLKNSTQDEVEFNLDWLCHIFNQKRGFKLTIVRVDLLANLIRNKIKIARELEQTKKLLQEKEESIEEFKQIMAKLKEINYSGYSNRD